jgi:hypothetical protein
MAKEGIEVTALYDGASNAPAIVRKSDERDDANGVSYSDNRVRIAICGMREELGSVAFLQGHSAASLERLVVALAWTRWLLIIVVVELAVIAFRQH